MTTMTKARMQEVVVDTLNERKKAITLLLRDNGTTTGVHPTLIRESKDIEQALDKWQELYPPKALTATEKVVCSQLGISESSFRGPL